MNAPEKLIACAAAFGTFHSLAAARQPTVVKASLFSTPALEGGQTSGAFAAHETHGTIAMQTAER